MCIAKLTLTLHCIYQDKHSHYWGPFMLIQPLSIRKAMNPNLLLLKSVSTRPFQPCYWSPTDKPSVPHPHWSIEPCSLGCSGPTVVTKLYWCLLSNHDSVHTTPIKLGRPWLRGFQSTLFPSIICPNSPQNSPNICNKPVPRYVKGAQLVSLQWGFDRDAIPSRVHLSYCDLCYCRSVRV